MAIARYAPAERALTRALVLWGVIGGAPYPELSAKPARPSRNRADVACGIAQYWGVRRPWVCYNATQSRQDYPVRSLRRSPHTGATPPKRDWTCSRGEASWAYVT